MSWSCLTIESEYSCCPTVTSMNNCGESEGCRKSVTTAHNLRQVWRLRSNGIGPSTVCSIRSSDGFLAPGTAGSKAPFLAMEKGVYRPLAVSLTTATAPVP